MVALQASVLEWVSISFSRHPPNPGTEPLFAALAGRFFTNESPGKAVETKTGTLSESGQQGHNDVEPAEGAIFIYLNDLPGVRHFSAWAATESTLLETAYQKWFCS